MMRMRLTALCVLPAAIMITALLAACTGTADQPAGHRSTPTAAFTPTAASTPPGSLSGGFVALANSTSTPPVVLYDSRTGDVVRQLLPGSRDGMAVSGLSVDRSGNVWVSYSSGPALKAPGVMGGDPQPDTCAGEIAVLHASTGRVSVFLRTTDNVLIRGLAISPDGQRLAYLESGCATGYFNSYLRVADVTSGRSWTIGQQIPRCHTITAPAWTPDSSDLVVGYAPPASAHWNGPQGACLAPLREELVEVSATDAQPLLRGRTAQADAHCEVTSAAAVAGGRALAIEACGHQGFGTGPAELLLYDSRLHLARHLPLGRCTDGNDLGANLTGTQVLVSAYLFCNPPGTTQPVTRLWSYRDGVLRLVTKVPGGGSPFMLMTW